MICRIKANKSPLYKNKNIWRLSAAFFQHLLAEICKLTNLCRSNSIFARGPSRTSTNERASTDRLRLFYKSAVWFYF